jgi:NSS family neurotransmitter:Na+ symporter
MQQDRGQWQSTFGFILAAAGSAIGLGNIWRFPYVAGENGGSAFVFIYLLSVTLICLPYLFAELAIGRTTGKNPVGAMLALKGKSPWTLVGGLGVLTGVCILSYYGVIAGWAFGYIFKSFVAPAMSLQDFSANALIAVPLFAAFLLFTILVVARGVERGIESSARILMPMLLILMLLLIARGLTLPGAMKGVEFLLKPDFSVVTAATVLAALGQAFFSLSLGMGAMITYGSYLPKTANLQTSAAWVAIFDTAIALLAGFMIFPALFALGGNPSSGPPLIFEVLPAVFEQMPLGAVVAAVFFILLSIAALTSTVSLLEVPVSYFVDERRWSRKKSVWVIGAAAFVLGLPAALEPSTPALQSMSLMGVTGFLSIMDLIWGEISLAVGAMLLCIFTGWVWGFRNAGAELQQGGGMSHGAVKVWGVFVRFICPIFIFLVLLSLFPVGARLLAALGLG